MGVPTIVRIEIGGRSDVHSTLARGTVLTELERDLCDEQMSRDPWVWVDRLSDRTGATIDLEGIRSSQDFLGDLVRTADDLEADMTALTSVVRGVLDPLESSLGTVDLELTDRELLEQARDACLERLGGDVS